jgi:hypothetical protein
LAHVLVLELQRIPAPQKSCTDEFLYGSAQGPIIGRRCPPHLSLSVPPAPRERTKPRAVAAQSPRPCCGPRQWCCHFPADNRHSGGRRCSGRGAQPWLWRVGRGHTGASSLGHLASLCPCTQSMHVSSHTRRPTVLTPNGFCMLTDGAHALPRPPRYRQACLGPIAVWRSFPEIPECLLFDASAVVCHR